MKTLLIIVAVVAFAAAAAIAYAARRPDVFRIERSIVIAAPADRIFPLIEDFRRWRDWSPYEDIDPALKRSYGGADKGVGATYAWEGSGKAGAGRMEIVEAPAPERVRIKLDFSKPFEARNVAEFALRPEGGGTRVTWAMSGPNPLVAKLMQLVMNFDAMVGGDFEKGLARMKAAAEAADARIAPPAS